MKRRTAAIVSLVSLFSASIFATASFTYAGYSAAKEFDPQTGVKRVIYLSNISASCPDWWKADSPKYAAFVWNDSSSFFVSDAFMEQVETNVYRIAIPSGYSNILFVRMNPTATLPSFDSAAGWWNQTADLTIPADRHCFFPEGSTGDTPKKATGNWGATDNHDSYTYTYTPS